MARMLHEVIGWVVAALVGWGTAHLYYRRSKRDLDALNANIERAVASGIVSAVRDATGKVKALAPASAPTEFKLF
jgi:hypothetical protein